MSPAIEKESLAKRFQERIVRKYFVRCGMSLILAVVVGSGLLTSKLLLELGLRSIELRYPLALLASFFAFLLLIRVWIWHVFCGGGSSIGVSSATNGDLGDLQLSGGGGSQGGSYFGGGDSGGAGASDSWTEAASSKGGGSGSSKGGGSWGFDLDLGDDWLLIALVIALVVSIACAGGYLVYAAPHVLPEAAWQVALASGLARAPKPVEHHNWVRVVLRSSSIPFVVVLILVIAVAHVAHSHCPQAVKLAEALYCPAP